MPTRIRAWHRHYDPTIGRYTQPDPLGFVDGPSVYAYALGNSVVVVDRDGRFVQFIIGGFINAGGQFAFNYFTNGGDLRAAFRCIAWDDVILSGFFRGIGGPKLSDLVTGGGGGRTKTALGLTISALTKKWLTPIPLTIGNYECECKHKEGFAKTITGFFQ
ncbi:MAG: RHS repeat-associated core domain-containing protein [Hyphomicrobium sp.]